MVGLCIEEQEASRIKAQTHRFIDSDRCLIGNPGSDDLRREINIDNLHAIGDAGARAAVGVESVVAPVASMAARAA